MKISEVKRNLERIVMYNGTKYVMKGCIIRRAITGEFFYQAELLDITAKSSLLIAELTEVDELDKEDL